VGGGGGGYENPPKTRGGEIGGRRGSRKQISLQGELTEVPYKRKNVETKKRRPSQRQLGPLGKKQGNSWHGEVLHRILIEK